MNYRITSSQSIIPEDVKTESVFGERVKQFFTSSELEKIFVEARIYYNIDSISNISFVPNERFSVVLGGKHFNEDKRANIVISFRSSYPTWEQCIEATYDICPQADIIILVYSDGEECDDITTPAGDTNIIGNLVCRNNRCGLQTYLVQARFLVKDFFADNWEVMTKYTLEYGPDVFEGEYHEPFCKKDKSPEKLPTKRQMQEAEFWVGCYYPFANIECAADAYRDDEIIYGWSPCISFSKEFDTVATWDDDGFHVSLEGSEDPVAVGILTWIWENRKEKIQEAYPDSLIKLKYENDKPVALNVRVFNIPMNELFAMEPSEKYFYGESVNGEERKFNYFMEEIVEEYEKAHALQAVNS